MISVEQIKPQWVNHTEVESELNCCLDEFEELAGARVDPRDSATVEGDSRDGGTYDDAAITLCMSNCLLDITGFEA